MPNVGKSTIFNVITKANAVVANYPFCTIEPNTGVISVADNMLEGLSKIGESAKLTFASIQFMDIAGLVQGASRGEGLGNKFLSHIREADIVVHVVRCFTDNNIASQGPVDPVADAQTVNAELLLADLETLQRAREKLKSAVRTGDKQAAKYLDYSQELADRLNQEEKADTASWPQDAAEWLSQLNLLSLKPVIYVANMDETDQSRQYFEKLAVWAGLENTVKFYAQLEWELADVDAEERQQYVQELGIEGGPELLVNRCYRLLDLITFYTINKNEARAWPLKKQSKAIQAAGKIHTDMQKGFIRAEVISAEELLKLGSFTKARETGKLRLEGRDYIVKDRDVIQVRFAV